MTRLPMIAQRMRYGLPLVGARAAIVLGAALAIVPTTFVLADVQVSGSPEAISIEAKNASIKEILAALGTAFDVHYQSSANLEKQISGTYEGTLQRVVIRVLEGYNVIVKTNKGRTEITVLETRNASAVAGASSPSPASKTAPVLPAPPALASSSSNGAERPAATTQAAQPSPVSKDAELPAPAASPAAPSPTIMLAEGPMPPVPSAASPGSVPTPVPEGRPSTVAPPSPTTGSTSSPVPEGRPSAVAPQLPGAAPNAPEPQGSAVPPPTVAGKTKPPLADNPVPARQ
jgi:hypothetical protein